MGACAQSFPLHIAVKVSSSRARLLLVLIGLLLSGLQHSDWRCALSSKGRGIHLSTFPRLAHRPSFPYVTLRLDPCYLRSRPPPYPLGPSHPDVMINVTAPAAPLLFSKYSPKPGKGGGNFQKKREGRKKSQRRASSASSKKINLPPGPLHGVK